MRRFRMEVDYALGLMPGAPEPTKHTRLDVQFSLTAAAEIMAMLREIMAAVDKAFPEGPEREYARRRFGNDLLWAQHYHEIAR